MRARSRYGITPPVPTSDGMTYDEIGAVLGVSHTRVQQIEAAALVKLRRFFARLNKTRSNHAAT